MIKKYDAYAEFSEGADGELYNHVKLIESTNGSLVKSDVAEGLYDALFAMTEMYTDMVNCGDCGNWDPETDSEVIAARRALAEARGES